MTIWRGVQKGKKIGAQWESIWGRVIGNQIVWQYEHIWNNISRRKLLMTKPNIAKWTSEKKLKLSHGFYTECGRQIIFRRYSIKQWPSE